MVTAALPEALADSQAEVVIALARKYRSVAKLPEAGRSAQSLAAVQRWVRSIPGPTVARESARQSLANALGRAPIGSATGRHSRGWSNWEWRGGVRMAAFAAVG